MPDIASSDQDLLIKTIDGKEIAVSSLRGRMVVLAFISKAACHTGHSLELIDGIMLDIGPSHLRSIACIVDLERGEIPRGDFSLFKCDVGYASRRSVADFLRLPMSGFYLPQMLVIDAEGRQRLLCVPRGDDYFEAVANFRESIEHIVHEHLRIRSVAV